MARGSLVLGAALGVCLAAGATPVAADDGPDPWRGPGADSEGWIYDDIDAAYAQAQDTGKPLLVAFR